MKILVAFAPFLAFALIDRLVGSLAGLLTGAAVALLLLAYELVIRKHTLKILEVGTAILFCGLALYFFAARPTWSVIAIRLCVDAGLLLIVLISLAVRRPFTLQYAREQVSPEFWQSPEFRKTNYVISGAWAVAFALMVLAESAILFAPQLPRRLAIWVIVLALVGAVKFTGWYPERAQRQAE